jgi:hypothetical protein
VAASGLGAGNLSLAVNTIHNAVDASIISSTNVQATGNIELSAADSSTVDSIAVGLSAAGGGALGAAVSKNTINNGVHTAITSSTVSSSGNISLLSRSIPVIRSFAAGVGISGWFSGQASVTTNTIANTVDALFTNSTVTATGSVSLTASDKAPTTVTTGANAVTTKIIGSLEGHTVDANANIVAFAGNVAASGGAAVGAAVVTTSIGNQIKAEIVNSTVTSSTSNINVSAISEARAAALAAGFSAGGFAGLNASVVTNSITTDTTADIRGASAISAGGDITVSATSSDKIDSLTFSLAASLGAGLGGAVIESTVSSDTLAYINGTGSGAKARILAADQVSIAAQSTRNVNGLSIGASLGTVAAGAQLAHATLGGSTKAYTGAYAEIGKLSGSSSVASLQIDAVSTDNATSKAYGLAVGIGAGTGNEGKTLINPDVEAYIDNSSVRVSGDIDVTANAIEAAVAETYGVSAGLLAVGVSLAEATVSSDVKAYVGGAP